MGVSANTIKKYIEKNSDYVIEIRRHIHAHPELSYQEKETASYIKRVLDKWGISYTQCTPTGVIALVKGKNPIKKTIALRADLDALPIEEKTNLSFASKNKGIMHACGHDVHTSCLLGAACVLHETRAEWEGTIKLIFQPGEEKNPGGASLMIKEGVLKNPSPQAIIALHVLPSLPAGVVAFNTGKVMASADEIHITIKGAGGHAASPHLTEDLIHIGSQIVVGLQELIARKKNPLTPSVLSMCAFNGGSTTNIIPSQVTLKGTFRSLDESWRNEAHQHIKQFIKSMSAKTTAKINLKLDVGYPCVYNNPGIVSIVKESAETYLGKKNVLHQEIRMGAEDFGFYTQKKPACFFRLGTGTPSKIKSNEEAELHTSKLHINEKAIPVGVGAMTWAALQLLKHL